jgi:hypothetical protein
MPHNVVKILTDEDGEPMPPEWHFPLNIGDADRVLCSGQVFGDGEGSATFKIKVVKRGGITCEKCLSILKALKQVKL